MTLPSFMNNMSSDETHGNEYGKRSVSQRTYDQRVSAGEKRNIVGAYKQSKLGQAYVDPSMRKRRYEHTDTNSQRFTISTPDRHKMGTDGSRNLGKPPVPPRQAFREPPSRGHNPYA